MSEKTIVTVTCDVCGCEIWSGDPESKDKPRRLDFLVWFDTEQDEGKGVKPYLSRASMNLCGKCADEGIRIHASGAMGYNDYRIKAVGR